MEGKKVKYLLGLLLLGVWGILGYRIYQKRNPEVYTFEANAKAIALESIPEVKPFQLDLDYQNPFLKAGIKEVKISRYSKPMATSSNFVSSRRRRVEASSVALRKKMEVKAKPKKVVFPKISYKGNLKLKTGRQAALLSINGKTMNLGRGEQFEGLELVHIYEDSIQLKYESKMKTIEKVQ